MKKAVFCCLLGIFAYFSASAQVDNAAWSPTGAIWVYEGSAFSGREYFKMVYQKDTLLDNRVVKKMVLTSHNYSYLSASWSAERAIGNTFMYASNDSVFWYNGNRFQLLYDFSAAVGAAWTVQKYAPLSCGRNLSDTSIFSVRAVSQRTFDGRQFTTVDAGTTSSYIGSLIIKNIGAQKSPLPATSDGLCTDVFPVPEKITCYRDNTRGTISFGGNIGQCNSVITSNQALARPEMNTLRIVPNPANDQIIIKNYSNLQIKEVKILDIMGKEYYSMKEYVDQSIDVAYLPNGVYVVQLITSENVVYATKMVKVK